jgi:hypothetical protein
MPSKEILRFRDNECDLPSFPHLELGSIQLLKERNDEVPGLESLDDSLSSSCSSSSFLSDYEPICQTSTKRKKRVSFHKAEIREYAVVVGDHPMCEDGLPISLDWKHTEEKVIDLATVHDFKSSRRFKSLRRLSYDDRVQRLQSVSGMTTEEVIDEETNLICRSIQELWHEFASDLTFSFDAIESHLRKVCFAEASKRHSAF